MHLAARWRSPSLGANVTIVGNAAGAESAALEVLARRAGCDYVVNLEWPAQGWEVGAYKAGAAALARRGVPGESAIVFAQDSLEMHEPERFADALARWQAAGMTPACLMTFPKHVGFTPLVASRLKAWLGARYNERAEWDVRSTLLSPPGRTWRRSRSSGYSRPTPATASTRTPWSDTSDTSCRGRTGRRTRSAGGTSTVDADSTRRTSPVPSSAPPP